MEQLYEECCVNPASVDFVEAHAAGTKVSLLVLGRYIMA
jgi:acyl transferase domain-containing protein